MPGGDDKKNKTQMTHNDIKSSKTRVMKEGKKAPRHKDIIKMNKSGMREKETLRCCVSKKKAIRIKKEPKEISVNGYNGTAQTKISS